MVRKLLPVTIAAVAVLLAGNLDLARAELRKSTSPDLFYNYYVPPGAYGGTAAQLYISPRPTPRQVGHTYVTYQPLMPHEFLYPHHRQYTRYNPGSGWTRTKVWWSRDWWNLNYLLRPPRPVYPLPCSKWEPLGSLWP